MTQERELPIKILQLTDFHLLADPTQVMMGINTDETLRAVLAAAGRQHWPVDLCLLTGDLAQEACPETYRRLYAYLESLGVPCYCLPGNHDDIGLIAAQLVRDSVYSQAVVHCGGWQIICLDSTIPGDPGGRLGDDQLALLEHCLELHPERHALIALHHSPLPTGSRWLDTTQLDDSDEFLALLRGYPMVRAVVFGHVHQAMDQWVGQLRLLATPSTCFQFKPANGEFALDTLPPGYRWLELYPDGRLETGVERLADLPPGLELGALGY